MTPISNVEKEALSKIDQKIQLAKGKARQEVKEMKKKVDGFEKDIKRR